VGGEYDSDDEEREEERDGLAYDDEDPEEERGEGERQQHDEDLDDSRAILEDVVVPVIESVSSVDLSSGRGGGDAERTRADFFVLRFSFDRSPNEYPTTRLERCWPT